MSSRSSGRNKRTRAGTHSSSDVSGSDTSDKFSDPPNSGKSGDRKLFEGDDKGATAMPSKVEFGETQRKISKRRSNAKDLNKDSSNSLSGTWAREGDLTGINLAAATDEASESTCDMTEVVAAKDLSTSVVGLTHRGHSVSLDMVLPEEGSRFGPEQINARVEAILKRWENLTPMQPDVFLFKLLETRGYDSSVIPAREYRV